MRKERNPGRNFPSPRSVLDSNVRLAGKNEAAGAADAELCHTEAVWAGKVRYYRLCVVSANYAARQHLRKGLVPILVALQSPLYGFALDRI
jgi:hypothetical protein